MDKEVLTCGNTEIEKNRFYRHKAPIPIGDIDIEKVLVSKKTYFGEKNYKYFIGYQQDNHKVKPLHIMFPKTTAHVKSYNDQTYGCIIQDICIICTIQDKVSANIKK